MAEYLRQKTEPDVKFVSSVPELELILQREDHLFQRNGYVDEESISVILGLFPKLGLEESTDGPFNWAKKWYRHEEEERLFGEIRVELDKLQAEIENSTVTKVQSDLALRLNDLNARFSALKQQFFSYSKDESSLPIQIFKHFVRKFDYARFYVTESQDIFNHFDVHVCNDKFKNIKIYQLCIFNFDTWLFLGKCSHSLFLQISGIFSIAIFLLILDAAYTQNVI